MVMLTLDPACRLVIVGGPDSGKTTLADQLEPHGPVRHTDDLVGVLEWKAASAEVATWFDAPGPWIIEGVSTVRALRKWMDGHPSGKPCDQVVFLLGAWIQLSKGQAAMAKGVVTVWNEIVGELTARGVRWAVYEDGELVMEGRG